MIRPQSYLSSLWNHNRNYTQSFQATFFQLLYKIIHYNYGGKSQEGRICICFLLIGLKFVVNVLLDVFLSSNQEVNLQADDIQANFHLIIGNSTMNQFSHFHLLVRWKLITPLCSLIIVIRHQKRQLEQNLILLGHRHRQHQQEPLQSQLCHNHSKQFFLAGIDLNMAR